MVQLSKHFTVAEFTTSATAKRRGIINELPPDMMDNALFTAERMEVVRNILGKPVNVNSCYRNAELNRAVGGSSTSAHRFALAVDFVSPRAGTPRVICEVIIASGIEFDQLILEFESWVHIGFSRNKERNQVLTAVKQNGKTIYLPGLV